MGPLAGEGCCRPTEDRHQRREAARRGRLGDGDLISAFLASLCCLGPLAFALLGLGGAGLLVKFEPYRPIFTAVTVALLGAGFYFTHRSPAAVHANWADVPAVARGGDGALVVSWAEAHGPAAHVYDAVVARSTDGGATWTRLGLLHDDGTPTEHGFVSLLGEPGGVRAFWLDGRASGGLGGAMTLRTAAVGATVGPGAVVDARVCDCCGTAAAWTGGGALVGYCDRGGDELRDVSASRGGPGGFSAPAPVHADGWKIAGCPVNGPAVAALDRRVAVAWYTYAGGSPRVRLALRTTPT